jgi:peroxiredoxin (alkyl hydroperoxide reductase subunit C)
MEKVEVGFPVIADTKMDVAKKYGLIQPGASEMRLARGVFFIDPEAKIRACFYYPFSNGRNIQEIKNLLVSMQASDAHQIATPAGWEVGDDVIVPTAGSYGDIKESMAKSSGGLNYLDWFICFKKMSRAELKQPQAATDKK